MFLLDFYQVLGYSKKFGRLLNYESNVCYFEYFWIIYRQSLPKFLAIPKAWF